MTTQTPTTKENTMTTLRALTDIDTFSILDGTIRECIREHAEGDELLVIDGMASPDPIDGEARIRIHGEAEPVCVSELRIRADQFHDYSYLLTLDEAPDWARK